MLLPASLVKLPTRWEKFITQGKMIYTELNHPPKTPSTKIISSYYKQELNYNWLEVNAAVLWKWLHSTEISMLDFYFNSFCYYNSADWKFLEIKVVWIPTSKGTSTYMSFVPSLITSQCTLPQLIPVPVKKLGC